MPFIGAIVGLAIVFTAKLGNNSKCDSSQQIMMHSLPIYLWILTVYILLECLKSPN